MTERKRGRPKKVGRYTYLLSTGGVIERNRVTNKYDTDTEVKRAAQKFFEAQRKEADRFSTPEERAKLTSIIVDLDGLADSWDDRSPFAQGPLYYEWKTKWGDQGFVYAVAVITRTDSVVQVRTNGLV